MHGESNTLAPSAIRNDQSLTENAKIEQLVDVVVILVSTWVSSN
jgi:hypothetical protein